MKIQSSRWSCLLLLFSLTGLIMVLLLCLVLFQHPPPFRRLWENSALLYSLEGILRLVISFPTCTQKIFGLYAHSGKSTWMFSQMPFFPLVTLPTGAREGAFHTGFQEEALSGLCPSLPGLSLQLHSLKKAVWLLFISAEIVCPFQDNSIYPTLKISLQRNSKLSNEECGRWEKKKCIVFWFSKIEVCNHGVSRALGH